MTRRASEFDPASVEFLDDDGLIPLRMTTLIGGKPGVGKSLWLCDMAARCSRNGQNVGLSMLEDGGEDSLVETFIIPRLIAARAVMENVILLDPMSFPEDIGTLRETIEEEDLSFIALDPLSSHLSVSMFNDQDARKAMMPLNNLSSETGCAIVAVHHTVKYTRNIDHALQAFGGSMGGLPGVARVAYVFGRHPKDRNLRVLAPAKVNFAAEPPPAIWEVDTVEVEDKNGTTIGEGTPYLVKKEVPIGDSEKDKELAALFNVTALAVVTTPEGEGDRGELGESHPKIVEATEFLLNWLCMGEQPVKDLQAAGRNEGIAWATMKRAKKLNGILHARHGHGPGTCEDCGKPWGKSSDPCQYCAAPKEKRQPSYVVWLLPPDHPALVEGDDD